MVQLLELEELPIRVTARGEWLHGDKPLHPRVADLFMRNVVPQENGRYRVQLGFAKQELEVDDTPYFVRRLSLHEDGKGGLSGVTLALSDGASELLDPSTLMQAGDHVLYCRLLRHGLSVPCRFSLVAYQELAPHAELVDTGAVLRVGGSGHPIRPYDARVLGV